MKSFDFLEFLGRQKTEQSSNDRVSFEASHEKNIRIIEGNLMKSTQREKRTLTLTPYAQKLPLGWTIIGKTCLGKVYRPYAVNVMKTNPTSEVRVTLFNPCINSFAVGDENPDPSRVLGENVFLRTESDEKPGLSTDDRKFLDIMDKGFHKTEEGNWSVPLPFRVRDIKIPNNKPQAEKRARTLESSLRRDPVKKEHFF